MTFAKFVWACCCCAVAALAAATAAAQPVAGERAYEYFSEYCMKHFPDLDSIRATMTAAKWQHVVVATEAERQRQFFTEIWQLENKSSGEVWGLETKFIHSKIWCSLSFSGNGFLLDRLAQRYNATEDRAAGEFLSKGYPHKTFRVLRTTMDGRRVNFTLTSSKESNEILVSHIKILGSDPTERRQPQSPELNARRTCPS